MIPNFAIKRLKAGAGVRHLRWSQHVNLPKQDGWKEDLLCGECEARIGKLENAVCKAIYDPIVTRGDIAAAYGPELHGFTLSLALRFIRHAQRHSDSGSRDSTPDDSLVADLRSACLDDPTAPTLFAYALPLPVMGPDSCSVPGVNTYFFEVCDGEVFRWNFRDGDEKAVAYVKLPGIAFFVAQRELADAFSDASVANAWLVKGSGGSLTVPASAPPFLALVRDRIIRVAAQIQGSYAKLSAAQIQKIEREIREHGTASSTRANRSFSADMEILRALGAGDGPPACDHGEAGQPEGQATSFAPPPAAQAAPPSQHGDS